MFVCARETKKLGQERLFSLKKYLKNLCLFELLDS